MASMCACSKTKAMGTDNMHSVCSHEHEEDVMLQLAVPAPLMCVAHALQPGTHNSTPVQATPNPFTACRLPGMDQGHFGNVPCTEAGLGGSATPAFLAGRGSCAAPSAALPPAACAAAQPSTLSGSSLAQCRLVLCRHQGFDSAKLRI